MATDIYIASDGTQSKSPTQATIDDMEALANKLVRLRDADPVTLTFASDKGKTLVSLSGSTINLPDGEAAAVNWGFSFVKLSADNLVINAGASDSIGAGSAGSTITNSTAGEIGATLTLKLADTTNWVVESSSGTWTVS